MSSIATFYCNESNLLEKVTSKINDNHFTLTSSLKNERQLLKAFLLGRLQRLFSEIFYNKIQLSQHNSSVECYTMDSKIIQFLIHGIIETGQYTLEGISYYTHIPLDVIYDAACGISKQFSITPWAKIVDLYIQVKPDVEQIFIDKLLETKNKNCAAFSLLLNGA